MQQVQTSGTGGSRDLLPYGKGTLLDAAITDNSAGNSELIAALKYVSPAAAGEYRNW